MQIGPRLGNSLPGVIRSFRFTKQKSRAFLAALLVVRRFLAYFSEATGPLEAAGSGSKPNTPTRYL